MDFHSVRGMENRAMLHVSSDVDGEVGHLVQIAAFGPSRLAARTRMAGRA